MEKKKVEILAPAGSFDSLKAAVAAGADAVYMGGTRFGARAYAKNADEEEMIKAIQYVHLHGRRLYMTVNTLFKEDELGELYEYLLPYYKEGLDGVIVQDLGALRYLRKHFPGMELHASTQMTITSRYGAQMLKELGCCRVVPARELSLEEIRDIHEHVGVDIETFVHGALCYCYSGQCLMSSLIGGRSGNRGRCAQPCRLPYQVFGQGKSGKEAVLNKDRERFVLSLKDLCTLDILPEIIEAGVYSLKIEGRMKSPRYTAGVVRIYRKYVDLYLKYGKDGYYVEPEDKKELSDLFNRGGFTTGYYEKHNGRDMVALKEKPEFREGNQKLFDYLDKTYVEAELKENITGQAVIEEGKPALLTLTCGEVCVSVSGAQVQTAKNQPMSEEKLRAQLSKTGGTPFVFSDLEIQMSGNIFLPVQALNELRREAVQKLTEAILDQYRRGEEASSDREDEVLDGGKAGKKETTALSVSIEERCQLAPVLACKEVSRVYLDADGFLPEHWAEMVTRCHQSGKSCFLTLPHIFREEGIAFLKKNREKLLEAGFDGVLARALEEIAWLKEENADLLFAFDASVYAWNTGSVKTLKETGAQFLTMPWELNSRELAEVSLACEKERFDRELIVYGHAPMMVSAQCITKTVKGCTRVRETLWLKDRTGARLPVKNHCTFCYNTILNPLPMSLLGEEEAVRRLNVDSFRLVFTCEGEKETEAILSAFADAFVYGKEVPSPVKEFTRGHFKRKVE